MSEGKSNWEIWDQEHRGVARLRQQVAAEHKGRSADKLAAQIKGALNAHMPKEAAHGSAGSSVHKSTAKDFKRPAPVKGEKDRADSMRTQIRMAAYNRKKSGETATPNQVPKIEHEVNPHKPQSSAEKLVAARDDRVKIEADLKKSTDVLAQKAWASGRAADHRQAADEYQKLAKATSSTNVRNWAKGRIVEHNGAADVADKKSSQAANHYNMVADRAQKASNTARTEGNHLDAARLHRRAAELTHSDALKRNHEALAENHDRSAEAEREQSEILARQMDARRRDEAESLRRSQEARSRVAARQAAAKTQPTSVENQYNAARSKANAASAAIGLPSDTEAQHQEAAALHRQAAALAPTESKQLAHEKMASNHAAQARNIARTQEHRAAESRPKAPAADRAAKPDTVSSYTKTYEQLSDRATKLSAEAQTAAEHKEAAQAHREAAALATRAASKAVHQARINYHLDRTIQKDDPASLSNKAARATDLARSNPTRENHLAARDAHREASNDRAVIAKRDGTAYYHQDMGQYHHNQANPELNRVQQPDSNLARASSYMDPASRSESDRSYAAVPGIKKSAVSNDELSSIKAYTRGSDSVINGRLRGLPVTRSQAKNNAEQDVERHIANLDSAFSKQQPTKDDLVTYRGVDNADNMFGKTGSRVGGEFIDHGFTSTATHASTAISFGSLSPGGALIRIRTPKGTRVVNPVSAGSYGSHENEILLPRGSRYRIVSDQMVRTNSGHTQRQIDLEHVGLEENG